MRIGLSLPDDLIAFADEEAARLGTSRSGLLAQLLRAERIKAQTRRYLDRYGWDIAKDEASWQEDQRRRLAEEYADDEW